MAIRKYKPTTRASWLVGRRLRRGHPVDAGEVAGAPAAQEGRPQQPGPDHDPAPGRWSQACLPLIDFKSLRQGRRAGQGRASSTTPTAPRASRCCTTPTARSATSSRRRAWSRARRSGPGSARTSSRAATCRCATSRSAHHHPRVELRPGGGRESPARPARRPARRQGGLARHAAPAVRRDAVRRRALPRHHR